MVCPHHLTSSRIAWFRRKEMFQISEGAKLGAGIDKDRFRITGNHSIGDFNLQIHDVMESDVGQYVCTVVIEDTSVQIIFNLVLKKAPTGLNIYLVNPSRNKSNTYFEESTKVTATENETIQLYCNISSGMPKETLEWVYRGNVIQSGGPGSTRLMLKSTHKNSGQYYCRANSSAVNTPITKSIDILVHYKPKITLGVGNAVRIIEGNSLNVYCNVDSSPEVQSVSWLIQNNGETRNYGNGRVLQITVITRRDTGVYICKATNMVGSTMAETSVTVMYAPDVTIVYENYTVNTKSKKLICLPKGVPQNYTFFQWQHKSEYGDHIRFLNGSQDGILLLPNIQDFNTQYYDNGVYICTVSNGIPGVSWTSNRTAAVYLSISGVPRIPMNLTLSTKEGNVLVGWIRNFDGGLKQTFFIEFRESNSKKWTVVQSLNMTEGDMLSWTIERLQTKTTYNFRMFAQNRLGRSNSTKEKSIIVGNEKLESSLAIFSAIPVAVSTSIILFMIILVVSVIVLWKQMVKPKNRVDSPLEHEEDNHYVEIEPNGMRELSINQTGNRQHGQKLQEHVLGGDQDRRSLDNVSSSSTDTDSKDHISLTSGISGNTTNPKDIYARR
ncbi:Hypothetical predicted protein, partial [Mytilus galloprovincialis]